MKFQRKHLLGLVLCAPLLLANEGGCNDTTAPTATQREQSQTNAAQNQLLNNQPAPVFDYTIERRMMIEIYKARQRSVATYSYVQSEFTGKVLWHCNSIGYPIPYATQLTNPHQLISKSYTVGGNYRQADGVIEMAEPNGLYSPAQANATWVPCVNANGKVTPTYEEKNVTVFAQPMVEVNGQLQPASDDPHAASFTIDVKQP